MPPPPPTKSLAQRIPFFYGWVVVGVAFVTMALGTNSRTAFSLLFPPILEEFGWDRATLAAAFTIGFVASTLLAPIIGASMDRFGPRIVLPFGSAMAAIGLALATYATQPWHFYVTLGLIAMGGTMFISYIGHILFVPNWFTRRRGLAMGIAFSGAGAGSITLFPWIQHLISTEGWRAAAWFMAALMVVVLVPLNAILQRREPAALGLEPEGGESTQAGRETAARDAAKRIVDPAWAAVDWTLARAIRKARFWWLAAAYCGGLYAWYAVQVHQTKFLIDSGISAETAAVALGLVPAGGIVGQIAIGHFSDRVGREWGWTLALSGYVACYLILLVMQSHPSEALMYAMVAAQGFLGYGLSTVYAAVPVEMFQGSQYGRIFGVFAGSSGAAAGIAPWITGILFDVQGDYTGGFLLAVAVSLFSILAMWLAAPRKVRLVAGRAR